MSAFEEGPPVSFESYLQQIKTSSFSELLYLVSYYGFFKKDEANLSLIKNSLTKGSLDCYFEKAQKHRFYFEPNSTQYLLNLQKQIS